jgi:hypothetical protein
MSALNIQHKSESSKVGNARGRVLHQRRFASELYSFLIESGYDSREIIALSSKLIESVTKTIESDSDAA